MIHDVLPAAVTYITPFIVNTFCIIHHKMFTVILLTCIGEIITNVLDFKRDAGLWHGVLTVSQTHVWCGLWFDTFTYTHTWMRS